MGKDGLNRVEVPSGEIRVFREGGLRVSVRELRWPGNDSVEIVDKWLYVLAGGEFVAEVHAIDENAWNVSFDVGADIPEEEPGRSSAATEGFIELDPTATVDYYFFLSPIRLAPEARDYLLTWVDEVATKKSFSSSVAVIDVPDPWEWAEDCHHKDYLPALREYYEWLEDENEQARLFVARVLKNWEESGLDIAGELRDPAELDSEIDREAEKRRIAEDAFLRFAVHVDCHGHRVVELSAQHSGSEDLAYAVLHWAVISHEMLATEPGRLLASVLVQDGSRLIRSHIFTESQSRSSLNFMLFRYGWHAAFEILIELAPAAIRFVEGDALTKMAQYLSNLEIQCGQREFSALVDRIPDKLKASIRSTIRDAKELYVEKFPFDPVESLKEVRSWARAGGRKTSKLIVNARPRFDALAKVGGAVVEIINVSIALRNYFEASDEEPTFEGENAIGALADALAHFAPVLGRTAQRTGYTRLGAAAGRLGPVAGFVGGAVDMLQFGRESIAGVNQNNYGLAAGNALASSGGAVSAVGAGMVVAGALFPKAAAGLAAGGPIVWGVGAILMFAGVGIAWVLAKSTYQDFARLCYFGRDHGEPVYYAWARGGLGSGTPVSEAAILMNLAGSFSIWLIPKYKAGNLEDLGHYWITIVPGHLTRNSVFEVIVKWYDDGKNVAVSEESFEVYPSVREIDSMTEAKPDWIDGLSATFDWERLWKKEKWIRFHTRYKGGPPRVSLRSGTSFRLKPRVLVRLRYLGDLSIWVPPSRGWLEIDTRTLGRYSSSPYAIADFYTSTFDQKNVVRLPT